MARYVRKYWKVRERCLISLNTAKTDRGSRYQHSLYARICDKAKFLSRLAYSVHVVGEKRHTGDVGLVQDCILASWSGTHVLTEVLGECIEIFCYEII